MKLKELVRIGLYAALFVTVDYISMILNLFKMPSGGSLSLASIILILSSYQLGTKKSLLVCLLSVLLMFGIGSISYYGIVSFLLDYVLGYCCYGCCSLFKNYKNIYIGIFVCNIVRLVLSTISGCVVFETELVASLVYNGGYIIPTMIVDAIVVPLLYSRIKIRWN